MSDNGYRPGDCVPQSGVYRVVHNQHRDDHEATLLDGGQFPRCTHCGDAVKFFLQKAAARIQRDSDFENEK
jgi:hypothetical protein